MGRKFVLASGNYLEVGTAGLAGFDYRFGTIAAVLNFASLPGVSTSADFFATNHSAGACVDFSLSNSAGTVSLDLYDGTNTRQAFGGAFSTGVNYLLAVTKATGTATGRVHMYVFSTNTWTHAALSGTSVDSAANTALTLGAADASGSTSFGLNGDMFAVAAWSGYAMSDQEVEQLARPDWGRSNPSMWDFWDTSRDGGDMMNTLGRYNVRQTARAGGLRGTVSPPAGWGSLPRRHRR